MLLLATAISLLQAPLVVARVVPTSRAAYQGSVHYVSKGTVSLSSDGKDSDVLVFDYGQNYEGHPIFEVVSAAGDTSGFEMSFAESEYAFGNYMSDGPLPLAAAMESYRVNRYNISKPGAITNRLIQGAFRYQKLNLSTAGELRLRRVGVQQTVDTTPLTELPGAFECSDVDLTRIWHTGARTAQLTEIPKGSIPNFWEVTDEGAFVESSAPQVLASGQAASALSYQLDFEVKPITGEFAFTVLADTLNEGIYISCDVGAGVISAKAGISGAVLASANLKKTFKLGDWHSVHAMVNMTEIEVAIDNTTVIQFSQTSRFYGSFGLGASLGHSAYFRQLQAATLDGVEIYSSSLTQTDFLNDFLMGTNPADTIVDGSRRDRIAYSGDLDVALGVTFASTYGTSFIEGSLNLLGSFRTTAGFFIPTAKIQQAPLQQILDINITGLIGYSFNLLTALAQNYEMTGDIAFATKWAPAVVAMLDWADSKLAKGVFTLHDSSLVGDWNYYDPPQTGASSKFNALYAYALQQTMPMLKGAGVNISIYKSRLVTLRSAIHSQLWSDSLGAYSLSDEIPAGFAQDANAIAILAGIPQSNGVLATALLSTLERELLLAAGPLAFTNSTAKAGFAQKISPYASAYHLRAALQSQDGDSALRLLKALWAPMANPAHKNYTNCFWETLNPDGTPGLGLGTSLCHGWAAGPTAELSRHVLGVQAVTPGYWKWQVKPLTLGLSWAKGRVPTARGTIQVEWKFKSGLLQMKIRAPNQSGVRGIIYLPQPLLVPLDQSVIRLNGKIVKGTSFEIASGEDVVITQSRKA